MKEGCAMSDKKSFMFIGVAFIIAALVLFLIGGYIEGWDYVKWLTSPSAFIFYSLVTLYALIVGAWLIQERIIRP